jgi:hypothetical protein
MDEEAIEAIATGLGSVARAIKALGNGNAASQMGAIEAASMKIHQGLESVAGALREIAEAMRERGE